MQINTKRLMLREFVADDWPAVLAYQRDPRYLRFYPWTDRTEADARDFVGMFLEQQAKTPRRKFQLAITLPEDGRLIGDCGIRRKPENDWEADIGYELDPEHWGVGYATEAARAMMEFGFYGARTAPRVLVVHRRQRGFGTSVGAVGAAAGRPSAGDRLLQRALVGHAAIRDSGE